MLHAQVSSGVKKSGIYYPREPMGLIALPSKFMQSLDMTFPVFPRTPAAVIFDMDGLLFDTEALYQRAIAAAALEGGYDVAEASPLMIGRPLEQSRQLLSKLYGEVFPVDKFLISMFRHFDLLAAADLNLKPGVVELLDTLDELQVPRAIATSSAHHRVQEHLMAHKLKGRFHVIVGHGDYTASKPAPDPFLVAAARLKAEPRFCLALEDSHNGVRSAFAAGMMTVMVPDLLEPTDEIRALYSFVACDLHVVRKAILNVREAPIDFGIHGGRGR